MEDDDELKKCEYCDEEMEGHIDICPNCGAGQD